MGFGTGGAAGWGAGTGLVGRDTALAALSGATLAEEDDGDFETGLAAGLTTGFAGALTGLATNFTGDLTAGLATRFITDLATDFEPATSLVVDFLAAGAFLTAAAFAFGCTTVFFAAGFATVLGATFKGVLLFLAGVFTSFLLWAVACG